MSRNSDVYSIPSFRILIGTGSVVKVGPFSGQLAVTIKMIAGGTLEIGGYGASMSSAQFAGLTCIGGTATYAIGNTFGMMYPLALSEAFSANASGVYYLYASGATCEVAIASGNSSI